MERGRCPGSVPASPSLSASIRSIDPELSLESQAGCSQCLPCARPSQARERRDAFIRRDCQPLKGRSRWPGSTNARLRKTPSADNKRRALEMIRCSLCVSIVNHLRLQSWRRSMKHGPSEKPRFARHAPGPVSALLPTARARTDSPGNAGRSRALQSPNWHLIRPQRLRLPQTAACQCTSTSRDGG